jgi:ketosteroid isomerase-like protein
VTARPRLGARRGIVAALALAALLASIIGVMRGFAPSRVESARTSSSSNDERVVLQVQREWMEAIRDKDVAALDRILADDYTFTDSRGGVTGKAESLRQARSSGDRMKAFQTMDAKAQVHGDTAVITGRLRVEGEAEGKPYEAEVRFTDILARIDGRWRAVAAHASRAGERRAP